MQANIDSSWLEVLHSEFKAQYMADLKQFLRLEQQQHVIYPINSQLFHAFNLTPFSNVKAVILGQDPYHGNNQAHGLSFSVQDAQPYPPSLRNIFQEYSQDLSLPTPTTGDLTPWAQEGVLLLNTVLTVRQSQPHSHQNQGWERFTDAAIMQLSKQREFIVFILWGRPAQRKASLIDSSKHAILKAPHPSPLSAYRGFFDSRPFTSTNTLLAAHHIKPIEWTLP